ncbi:YeeE/YedE family protein [Candidatus Woesearchaeota archaeon]|nr:MAG: YeeE/YedE family protein [Candidatus Woesearchaeota archaeon]
MRSLAIYSGGLFFGAGLALSAMAKPEVVLSFLQLKDLGLLLVMGGAVLIAMIAYKALPRIMRRPALGGKFNHYSRSLDKRVVLGAAIFGIGWGVSGLCPGAALASVGVGNYPVLLGIAGMFAGAYAASFLSD